MAPSVAEMEACIRSACDNRLIPGAALFATDKTGRLDYEAVFGAASLEKPSNNVPLAPDTTMWFASCTKLVTSIAALQCVERGLITLDEDVRPYLPELRETHRIHVNADGTYSHTAPNEVATTLRHFLSHSSGYGYEFNCLTLKEWRSHQSGKAPGPNDSLFDRFHHPIMFEPGESWSYGPSTDWAGLLIERLTHQSLEEYFQEHIWGPLGITDLTLFLSTRSDLQARRGKMSWREDRPEAVLATLRQPCYEKDFPDCQGGGAMFGSPREFVKILRAVLLAADELASDEEVVPPAQLLRRSTAELLFQPQLSERGIKALQEVSNIPRFNHMLGDMPSEARKDWSLGGMLLLDDIPGGRNKGTLTWGGTPNLTWWIDRTAGITGFYASQIMPIGDPKSNEMVHVFENAMYQLSKSLNEKQDTPLKDE